MAGKNGVKPSEIGERQEKICRPKLLFLAYAFPPANATACVRTWNIAKYLTRLGWDVTVVTPHSILWRHAESSEDTERKLKDEGIRRIQTGHQWRCLSPDNLNCWNEGLGFVASGICRRIARFLDIDRAIGWIRPAERACANLTAEDVDIILATGDPFPTFKLAARLSKKLGCPYVLDYRDPWTDNPHGSSRPSDKIVREEKRLLEECSAATIVSPSWAESIDRRFGVGNKVHVITNGYDPEELGDVQPYNFGHFAIVYAGTFYKPKRIISPVMAALKRLNDTRNGSQGPEWRFHYYGIQENHVLEEAKRFDLMDRIVVHGRVSQVEAFSAVRGAGVAVVITSVTEDTTLTDKGIVTGKVFEALGLGTPVLLVAPFGSDVEIIVATAGLVRAFTGSNIDGMASFLADAMRGQLPKPKNPGSYEWTNIAKRLDAILREAAEKRIQPMHGRQRDHDQQTV